VGKTSNVKFVGIIIYALLLVMVLLSLWGTNIVYTTPDIDQAFQTLQLLGWINLVEFALIVGLLGILLSKVDIATPVPSGSGDL
jgi:hypothetical protein